MGTIREFGNLPELCPHCFRTDGSHEEGCPQPAEDKADEMANAAAHGEIELSH